MAPKAPFSITIFLAFLPIFLFASASTHSASHNSGKSQDEVKFGYTGPTGPNNWSHLSPSYSMCSRGKLQSPVNILKNETVLSNNLRPLVRSYHPANATLVNHGYSIQLVYEAGVLIVDGKNYTLKQMHWHTPSEHQIEGIQFPAELHIVHKASDGSIAVVGMLYKFGKSDKFLSMLQGGLVELAKDKHGVDEEPQVTLGKMYLTPIKRHVRKYYRYIGSLTTPPCSENVIWNVLHKVRSISPAQVKILKTLLKTDCKNNCRPVQPLNGRHVEMCSAPKSN